MVLLAIRDNRLYRDSFDTFEDYCRERWGMRRDYAYRLMDAAGVVGNLKMSPIGDILPATESQARPLSLLSPAEQVDAWQAVIEAAGESKITAGQVQRKTCSPSQSVRRGHPHSGCPILCRLDRCARFPQKGHGPADARQQALGIVPVLEAG